MNYTLTCASCGKEYIGQKATRLYCPLCYIKRKSQRGSKWAGQKEVQCLACTRTFNTARKKKYCIFCRARINNEQARESIRRKNENQAAEKR